ncbi:MAG: hypothetical protein OXF06_14530 [Bacteroidetes bacterium]|nr:hypothetical protein [Bacteroidota bacterium]
MMNLSEQLTQELRKLYHFKLTNIPVLDQPVLIVLDYSPLVDQIPISIAFDYSGGPKCWLSVCRVRMIDGQGPFFYQEYREFCFENRRFYPYSIQSFPMSIFQNINEFTSACRTLYRHAYLD